VPLSTIYARYRRWCDEQKASPLSATAFGEAFKAICERVALREAPELTYRSGEGRDWRKIKTAAWRAANRERWPCA